MPVPNLVLGPTLCLSRQGWAEPLAILVSFIARGRLVFRLRFILTFDRVYRLDCQSDLSSSITKLNKKSKLFVIREAPQTLLPKLFKAWRISHLVFERDTDPYAKERDAKVVELARKAGVEVVATRHGRTLYDPDELVQANGGKPTMSITQVQHVRHHPASIHG